MPVTLALRPPRVIPELVTALQATVGPETLVRWGLLPELPVQRERVYLLGVTNYALERNTRGHHVRREDFGVRGLIEVQQLGDDGPELVSSRAWELLGAFDDAARDEDTLSDCRYNGAVAVAADEVVPMSDGWLARIIFTLGIESVR